MRKLLQEDKEGLRDNPFSTVVVTNYPLKKSCCLEFSSHLPLS